MTSFLSFEEINNSLKDTQAKINNQKYQIIKKLFNYVIIIVVSS